VPALAAWLVAGVALSAWVGNLTYQRLLLPAARGVVPVQTGASIPPDMPSDFPLYPGARVVGSLRGGGAPRARGVEWVTADAPNHVYDFYRAALKQSPWRVLAAVPYPIGTISFTHERSPVLSCSLTVGKAKSGKTVIVFQYAPLSAAGG